MTRVECGDPFLIGLTGNIATGKSTVASMLARLGAETVDADRVAHQVMCPGTGAHAQIVALFGPQMVAADGSIDRRRLGQLVFSDPEALARLEAIVHPPTLMEIERRISASPSDVMVIEAIKLFQSGLADRCHTVWATTCRREQQIERLVQGREISEREARWRVEAQRPQEERAARADVIIDNSGSLSETWKQVLEAWRQMVNRTSSASVVSKRQPSE